MDEHPKFKWLRAPGPVAEGMKVGLLGGSFNPAHEGHLHVSSVALNRLGLDYVWWLVTPQNPLKSSNGMAPFSQRLAEASKFEHHPRIVVAGFERTLGTHYTVETLRALKRRFPQINFVWLMGSDNLAGFARWSRWPDIAQSMPIAVVLRPGTLLAPLSSKAMQRFAAARVANLRRLALTVPPAIGVITGPRCPQSATAIRQGRRSGALVEAGRTC
ncbi:MAG: nicotinate-nucleotide adenylyltransferase [Alphaproteobacteria bacterium]|nr:nicotinate-nucleotide adenylyltransferase [Alphaproteobacteria bacterium]MBV9061367.1 nicotinate-nucleotide adenylyltransferase [Alphaproteobacteria bacterium]